MAATALISVIGCFVLKAWASIFLRPLSVLQQLSFVQIPRGSYNVDSNETDESLFGGVCSFFSSPVLEKSQNEMQN